MEYYSSDGRRVGRAGPGGQGAYDTDPLAMGGGSSLWLGRGDLLGDRNLERLGRPVLIRRDAGLEVRISTAKDLHI